MSMTVSAPFATVAAAAVARNVRRESFIDIILSWDNVQPMKNYFRFFPALALAFTAQAADRPAFHSSERLQKLTADAVTAAVERFGKGGLTKDKIALTVIDLADPNRPAWAGFRGSDPVYPASVVKLFYLAAAFHQLDSGALARTPELERALHDMIVD